MCFNRPITIGTGGCMNNQLENREIKKRERESKRMVEGVGIKRCWLNGRQKGGSEKGIKTRNLARKRRPARESPTITSLTKRLTGEAVMKQAKGSKKQEKQKTCPWMISAEHCQFAVQTSFAQTRPASGGSPRPLYLFHPRKNPDWDAKGEPRTC
ncbi:hypothetical protein BDK51DRAFT_34538 [Blyttiomyces helicus]|uniref:Uncharacterized protein n=1 Tax=Blyttiomyces helicus TaxID=388810 RepID=A0A4P9WH89_9FUNG|nr:hypothetical protein BDK51DRAFT_34538 [Blyttiomyces helicus]|eukprot:RKO92094.1 hypothetical protein BDK51DRAFT_34538 [Blyttiomyces helicus]